MLEYGFTDRAKAQFNAFPRAKQEQILDLICWVCDHPKKNHSGPIDADGKFFTADRGSWRVIFTLSEDEIVVVVVAIAAASL